METVLEQIREFADGAHGTQLRKYTPERYIVHPVRVMELCRQYTGELPVLAAALLHDVLEDTAVTEAALHHFLITVMDTAAAAKTVQLVKELTDVYVKDKYPHWNRRKRKLKEADRMEKISGAAQTVKYADIIDNSMEIVQFEDDFAPVYLTECKALLKRMVKGDGVLRQRAVTTVDGCLQQLKKQRPSSRS